MPGEAVDEIILAAVGLIGDNHDVAPGGKLGKLISLLFREELLNGGEDHAPGGHLE